MKKKSRCDERRSLIETKQGIQNLIDCFRLATIIIQENYLYHSKKELSIEKINTQIHVPSFELFGVTMIKLETYILFL